MERNNIPDELQTIWNAHVIIVKMNEQEAELILGNLRTRFETGTEES
jgi:hypothetical protein